jgi:nicotinamidase-related amidase
MTTKALIIVDMLNDFIDENGTLYCGDTANHIVPFIKTKLDEARKLSNNIIHMTDAHDEDDKEFKIYPKHCIDNTWGGEIIKELKPLENEQVIKKKTVNSFYQTRLETFLERTKPNEIDIVGVCTSICVMDLVSDLSIRGYKTRVLSQGVADFDQDFHEFALQRMEKVYGAEII